MPKSELERLALLMEVNCVRNTVIEKYHAHGKLSQDDMAAFNREVANKLYTFLHYMFNAGPRERELFLSAVGLFYPTTWDPPRLDPALNATVKHLKKHGMPFSGSK